MMRSGALTWILESGRRMRPATFTLATWPEWSELDANVRLPDLTPVRWNQRIDLWLDALPFLWHPLSLRFLLRGPGSRASDGLAMTADDHATLVSAVPLGDGVPELLDSRIDELVIPRE
jgi:hypothetical protein